MIGSDSNAPAFHGLPKARRKKEAAQSEKRKSVYRKERMYFYFLSIYS